MLPVLCVALLTQAPPPIGVAVFPISPGSPELSSLATEVQMLLAREIGHQPGLVVVDRSPAYLERLSSDTAARRGFIGARFAVFGTVGRSAQGQAVLSLKAFDIESSESVLSVRPAMDSTDAWHAALSAFAVAFAQRIKERRIGRDPMSPAFRQVPTDALKEYSLGLLYIDRGDTAQAAARFQAALDQFPRYSEACLALQIIRPHSKCT